MNRLLALLSVAALLTVSPARAAIVVTSLGSGSAAAGAGTDCTFNTNAQVNAGDPIIIGSSLRAGANITAFSDGTNTYTLGAQGISGTNSFRLKTAWTVPGNNLASGTAIHVTFSSASGAKICQGFVITGINGGAKDTNLATPTAGTATTTPSVGPTATLANASEVAVAFLENDSGTVITEASGWTTLTNQIVTDELHSAYIVVSSTAAITYAPTQVSSAYVGDIVTFKPANNSTAHNLLLTGVGG